jgi:spore germination protein KB
MAAPYVSRPAKAGKCLLAGTALSALFMLIISMRDICVLGPLLDYIALPSFETVRTINLAKIFTRMESIYAVFMIFLLFFRVCIFLYVTVLGLAQIFSLHEYGPLAYLAAVFTVCYGMIVFDSSMENAFWGASAAPVVFGAFEYVLPAASLPSRSCAGLTKRSRGGGGPMKAALLLLGFAVLALPDLPRLFRHKKTRELWSILLSGR